MNMIENNMIPILKERRITGLREPTLTEEEQQSLDLMNELHGLRHLLKVINIDMDKLMVFVKQNARPDNLAERPELFNLRDSLSGQ